MWILMLDTYVGGIGTFPKGHKLDLAPDILEHIPKGSYKKSCAPWEEKKDVRAIEQAKLKAEVKDTQLWADILQSKADEARQKADQLMHPASEKQDEAKRANEKAGKAANVAKKKDATDEDKGRALELVRYANRKDLEHQKTQGQLMVTMAEAGLKQMEADNAKREAEKLTKTAEAEAKKQAEKKAKAEAKAKAMAKAKEVMIAEAAEADAVIETANQFAKKKEARAKAEAELNVKVDAGLKDSTGKLGLAGNSEAKNESESDKPAVEQIDESVDRQIDEPVDGSVDK